METQNTTLELVHARHKKAKQREQEEEVWKLTWAQVTARVQEIRACLQDCSDRLAGLRFDVMNSDKPASLDHNERPRPDELAERLNPLLAAYYERL